ncbi:Vps54-like protein [Kipferlia bialata]|uniref:Vps54-like protein n=1 Tax=Kipferlia bialata TaxID=797122 RepID=A0A9K3D1U5_9EUKA|nr:Vps54-like protein [Kipferlia bialata]|eukprot:g8575.t1
MQAETQSSKPGDPSHISSMIPRLAKRRASAKEAREAVAVLKEAQQLGNRLASTVLPSGKVDSPAAAALVSEMHALFKAHPKILETRFGAQVKARADNTARRLSKSLYSDFGTLLLDAAHAMAGGREGEGATQGGDWASVISALSSDMADARTCPASTLVPPEGFKGKCDSLLQLIYSDIGDGGKGKAKTELFPTLHRVVENHLNGLIMKRVKAVEALRYLPPFGHHVCDDMESDLFCTLLGIYAQEGLTLTTGLVRLSRSEGLDKQLRSGIGHCCRSALQVCVRHVSDALSNRSYSTKRKRQREREAERERRARQAAEPTPSEAKETPAETPSSTHGDEIELTETEAEAEGEGEGEGEEEDTDILTSLVRPFIQEMGIAEALATAVPGGEGHDGERGGTSILGGILRSEVIAATMRVQTSLVNTVTSSLKSATKHDKWVSVAHLAPPPTPAEGEAEREGESLGEAAVRDFAALGTRCVLSSTLQGKSNRECLILTDDMDRRYYPPACALHLVGCLAILCQTVRMASCGTLKIAASTLLSSLAIVGPRLVGQFNTWVGKLILGAGAIKTVGVRSISAKHVGVAVNAIDTALISLEYYLASMRQSGGAAQGEAEAEVQGETEGGAEGEASGSTPILVSVGPASVALDALLQPAEGTMRDLKVHRAKLNQKLDEVYAGRASAHSQAWVHGITSAVKDNRSSPAFPVALCQLLKERSSLVKVAVQYLPASDGERLAESTWQFTTINMKQALLEGTSSLQGAQAQFLAGLAAGHVSVLCRWLRARGVELPPGLTGMPKPLPESSPYTEAMIQGLQDTLGSGEWLCEFLQLK